MEQNELLKRLERKENTPVPYKVSQHVIVRYWERFNADKSKEETITDILNDLQCAIEIPRKWVSRIATERLLSPKADKYLWNKDKIYVINGQNIITVYPKLEDRQINELQRLSENLG